MPKPLIAGNWKMNTNLDEAQGLIQDLSTIDIKKDRQVLICPPFVSLDMASKLLADSQIQIGAQNFHYDLSGAYTGEISGPMLKSLGVDYVILGHSERREIFSETDDLINKKVLSALDQDLKPILCVGETEDQRQARDHYKIVSDQVLAGLKGVTREDFDKVVIAYEPVWAIGTGKTASADDAEDMCAHIRKDLAKIFGQDLADSCQILYGGSVKADTISELMAKANVNGALVGGASLDGKEFEQIVNYE